MTRSQRLLHGVAEVFDLHSIEAASAEPGRVELRTAGRPAKLQPNIVNIMAPRLCVPISVSTQRKRLQAGRAQSAPRERVHLASDLERSVRATAGAGRHVLHKREKM